MNKLFMCHKLEKTRFQKIIFTIGVSESMPTCGVTTYPPVQGQKVMLSCAMTYRVKPDTSRLSLGVVLSPSISWEELAGKYFGNKSTGLINNAGGRLETEFVNVPTGTEIPSYTCTASFRFIDMPNEKYAYALNTVSWTCASAPVLVWCTYCHSVEICSLLMLVLTLKH